MVLFSLSGGAAYPCGQVFAGWGPGTSAGELLISLQAGLRLPNSGPLPWNGPGEATRHSIPIPADTALAGLTFFVQAVLRDPTVPRGIVLSAGLDLVLGY